MRKTLARIVLLLIIPLVGLPCYAAVDVHAVRMWPAPDNTRLVFDLTRPVKHTLFTLKAPDRVVIDIDDARFAASLPDISAKGSFIRTIRHARRDQNSLRIVLDLTKPVKSKSFLLKPHREYGHRLVLDLYDASEAGSAPRLHEKNQPQRAREVIIAIDAGHGGEDPGAIGRKGTREKDVVLAISRRLQKLIDKEPGMRAIMIRTGDYFIPLQKRVTKARNAQADLFISIHADAFKDRRARGSSVFVLSENGASSEVARFLATSENNSDLIGGVSLDDKDDLLKLVLVDMVKNSTMEESHQVATRMLGGLKGVTHLHKRTVEQAGFRVLKAPDIPSVLVETAFISNPREEKKLRSRQHQQVLARALFNGVRSYFQSNPPPGTVLAIKNRQHRIARGETLSAIAERYQVSIHAIRRANQLQGDLLRVGQVIQIPYYSGT